MHIVTDKEFTAFLRSGATVAPVVPTPGKREMSDAEKQLLAKDSLLPPDWAVRHIAQDGAYVLEVNEVFVSLPRGDDLVWWAHLPTGKCVG